MAVPKRKISKARRDKRRASNIKMTAPNVIECPNCHEPSMPHRVCAACGYYKNTEVIEVK
ncbi:50S ribosomal protein L32 [Helicovermis profundi]|uniref:Large ribosomal subunit protein bL32 n=1 Tax=Helicovermis profundi TaxID=3065157 RepID=A0AAU9E446_9FIRM|nr:50S ribosomal protein L32 [Clostridia bacterium S502]